MLVASIFDFDLKRKHKKLVQANKNDAYSPHQKKTPL